MYEWPFFCVARRRGCCRSTGPVRVELRGAVGLQKLDDLRLGCVHERIIAVAGVEDAWSNGPVEFVLGLAVRQGWAFKQSALLFPGGIRCQRISCRMNETPLPLIPPCCVRPCERSTRTTWSRSRFPVHRTASKRNPCYGTLLPKLLLHPRCVSALLSLLGPYGSPFVKAKS